MTAAAAPRDAPTRDNLVGGASALAAFLLWGFAPLYFKLVGQVPPVEILAHRIVWAVPLLIVLVAVFRRGRALLEAMRDRGVWRLLLASTVLLSFNWIVFIWAVANDRVLEVSLGYYINPLINVALGMVFLRERLSPAQGLAIALAGAGVLNLVVQAGGLPWVSLTLGGSFAVYGLIRKTVRLGASDGLLAETALLLPFALGYLVFLGARGTGAFAAGDLGLDALLILAGAVTTAPLVTFALAARRLRYTTLGLFQYLAPTCQFLLAVLVFGEVFTAAHLVTFGLIWTALAVYSYGTWRGAHELQRRAA